MAGGRERGLDRRLDDEQVVQLDLLERRPELVKAVVVAADDREVEVQLGARGKSERQSADLSSARYRIARSR
jgi:hypothetical protein